MLRKPEKKEFNFFYFQSWFQASLDSLDDAEAFTPVDINLAEASFNTETVFLLEKLNEKKIVAYKSRKKLNKTDFCLLFLEKRKSVTDV
jgi:hypothetical protein